MSDLVQAWPHMLLAWTAFSLLVLSPGPTLMAIMMTSMAHGRRAGMILTTGCMTGSTLWGAVANIGLSFVLNYFAQGLMLLKFLGGIYLLWLAFKALRAVLYANCAAQAPSPEISSRRLYFSGLALHLTNPKVMLGWGAMATIAQQESHSINVLLFTYLGGLCITYSVHYFYAFLFASRPAITFYHRAKKTIQLVLGVFFTIAGTRLILDDFLP